MVDVVEGIQRVGYRRWYERQLLESHLWLVVCIVSLVMTAAGLELLALGDGLAEFTFDASLIAAGIALGWLGWRRYAHQMMTAQFVSEQAECPTCGRYGFRLGAPGGSGRALDACCPRCAHHWTIALPPA